MSLDGWSIKRHVDKRCDELEKYIVLIGKKLILLEERISSLTDKGSYAKQKEVRSKVQKGVKSVSRMSGVRKKARKSKKVAQ